MIEVKRIEINKIHLCKINPRTTDIDINVTGDYFREKQELLSKTENEIALEILSFEGELNDFKTLIISLSSGYNPILPRPFLINWNDEYIVVEGNRRILALKLLNGVLKMPSLSSIEINADDEEILKSEELDSEEVKQHNISSSYREKNYNDILKVISDYSMTLMPSNEKFIVSSDVISNGKEEDSEIKVAIFSNHITGKSRGKRNWNRGRTLLMYLSFIGSNGTYDNDKLSKISELLNRDIQNVKQNIDSAFLIKNIIENADENKDDYFKQHKVSALEKQFIKNFFNYNKEDKYSFFISKIEGGVITPNKDSGSTVKQICTIIVYAHKHGLLKTRMHQDTINKIKTDDRIQNFLNNTTKFDFNKPITSNTSFSSLAKLSEEDVSKIKDINERAIIVSARTIFEDKKIIDKYKNIRIFKEKFVDEKFQFIKRALEKLKTQLAILEYANSFSDMLVNGLVSATRAFSEIFIQVILLDKKIRQDIVSLSNGKAGIILKNNKNILMSDIDNFININEKIILNAEWEDSSVIFTTIRHLFNENVEEWTTKLNDALNRIHLINEFDNNVWKWLFDEERYKAESQYIHSPHAYETLVNERLFNAANYLSNNIKMVTKIITQVFN